MYVKLDSSSGMKNYEGKKVELTGRISSTPWQHMMAPSKEFPYDHYFDVGKDQIVIYTKEPVTCKGELLVRGTVIKLQGSSKRPGDTKADDSFIEYHINVDEWQCR